MRTACLISIAVSLFFIAHALLSISESLKIVKEATGKCLIFDFSKGIKK